MAFIERQMVRYFFDIQDERNNADDVGVELASLHAVKVEALRTLTAMAADLFPHDGTHMELSISVRDESGKPVLNASVSFMVTEPGA